MFNKLIKVVTVAHFSLWTGSIRWIDENDELNRNFQVAWKIVLLMKRMAFMKIVWASLGIVALAALSLASCVLYDIHHEVDRTPIVEIPFDPSKKDVIKLENFKMPRSGRFNLLFYASRKDKKDIYENNDSSIVDYLRNKNNIFTINYKVNLNGKELFNTSNKPIPYSGDRKSVIYKIFYAEKFRKNDVLDIFIENQYPTEKFKDFDVVFKIHEVKPESK